jgi:hypothetical protein
LRAPQRFRVMKPIIGDIRKHGGVDPSLGAKSVYLNYQPDQTDETSSAKIRKHKIRCRQLASRCNDAPEN